MWNIVDTLMDVSTLTGQNTSLTFPVNPFLPSIQYQSLSAIYSNKHKFSIILYWYVLILLAKQIYVEHRLSFGSICAWLNHILQYIWFTMLRTICLDYPRKNHTLLSWNFLILHHKGMMHWSLILTSRWNKFIWWLFSWFGDYFLGRQIFSSGSEAVQEESMALMPYIAQPEPTTIVELDKDGSKYISESNSNAPNDEDGETFLNFHFFRIRLDLWRRRITESFVVDKL